jgi:uncharacterized membrane protein YidH (DUF202 family)
MLDEENKLIDALEEKNDPKNEWAIERTELALERTHLAWIRTLFTLMTASIAIDKGLELIHEARLSKGDALFRNAHAIGISLTSIGSILLLIESNAYVHRSRQLARMKNKKSLAMSTPIVLSLLVFLLGISLTYFLIIY